MINHTFAVTAYKDSPYLVECLESLKNQTVESKIHITTSTPSEFISAIANKYGVELFIAEPGKGIGHDWSFCLAQAKTKYATLAHQDDIYMPGYAEACIDAAENFDDTLICFTEYSEIAGDKDRRGNFMLRVKRFMLWFFMPIKKNISTKFWKRKMLSMGCPIAAPSVMINMEKLPGFQFSRDFAINIDWDAWYRMSGMEGRFVYINKVLMKHRIHPGSMTSGGLEANQRQEEDIIMFRRFWPRWIAGMIGKLYALSYLSNKKVMR